MPAPPWKTARGVGSVVDRWMSKASVRGCFTAQHELSPEAPAFESFPDDLDPRLLRALRSRNIDRLFTHQRRAIDAARAGGDVVVATPTASGKSLCFHLPVLDDLARDPSACALYLYPTKALSRDQEQSLHRFVADAELSVGAVVYDGDTPGDARRAARQRSNLVLTNPDMLHAGILPQHASWARTFQNLKWVILDEVHTYRGVFGSHVANVIARLKRVAAFHGSSPQFISATATIGNPVEHAARITGTPPERITLVDRSTAPRGKRRVLVYNPPIVNAELGIRGSYLKASVRLAADLIAAQVPTIVFGQSRNAVEIMLKYLRDRFDGQARIRDAIVAYRSGYLPDQRRRVERGLREGQILCVVATSALELGIDIGDLEAVVCAGYPGSLAETWQRWGRAGRRSDDSLAVLVTNSAPLDQYVAQHPELILDGGIEQARIEPENTEVVVQHLKCAAFELPFRAQGEAFGPLPCDDTEAALGFLEDHGVVHASKGRFHWSTDAFPANHVSLRSIGWDNTVIIDVETEETLAELDWHATPTMLHEQAIYQHDGAQFQVEQLDHENHKAYVRRVEPDYFTTAMRHVKVRVLEDEASAELPSPAAPVTVGWGDVCVTEKVVGYKKIKFHTHENAGYGDVRLPEVDLHTTSYWLTLPPSLCHHLGRAQAVEGLRGLAHALELAATVALMCDPRDLARAIEDEPPEDEPGSGVREAFSATAYLYDNVPGGVGLSERIYERTNELLESAVRLVDGCACAFGCPSCVGATVASSTPHGAPPPGFDRKRAAFDLARLFVAAAASTPAAPSPPRSPTPASSSPRTLRSPA